MKCLKCGTENKDSLSFCIECGEELNPSKTKPDTATEKEDCDVTDERDDLLDDKPLKTEKENDNKKSFKISNSKNPMFVTFILTFLISLIFCCIAFISFTVSSATQGGAGFGLGLACGIVALFGFFIAFYFNFAPALSLRSMQKGNFIAKWELSDDDLNEHAKDLQKGSFNKMFWALVLITLFSIVLAVLFLTFGGDKGIYMAIPMFLIIIVCAAIAFLMPKTAEKRMKKLGRDVIIGKRGVYANGVFYYWRKLVPELTTAAFNDVKRQLTISFTISKKGAEEVKQVIVKVPSDKLNDAVKLINRYQETSGSYRARQLKKLQNASEKENIDE